MPTVSDLITKTALTAIENSRITSVSSLVKKNRL